MIINVLAEEIKGDSKDSNKLNAIYDFLKNCYEIPSLGLVIQRFPDLSNSQQEANRCMNQVQFHLERALQVVGDESEEKVLFFLEEIEKSYLSLQDYSKNKTKEFELLRNIIDEFWNDLPSESQKAFEVWAKELTVDVAKEVEDINQFSLVFKGQVEELPIHKTTAIENAVNRLTQVINDVEKTNLIKAKLNFIASIFKQRLTIEEDSIELPSHKKTQKLSKEQIHQAGMRAFEDLLEDYGDVLEALAKH